MIERGLVYIQVRLPTPRFVGCGALVEGGHVATCRHVWREARQGAADDAELPEIEVEVEYPHFPRGNAPFRSVVELLDTCAATEGPEPDLVLLLPKEIPSGLMTLQLAAQELFEIGAAYAIAGKVGLNPKNRLEVRDVRIDGLIKSNLFSDGRRQFSGPNQTMYWSDRGCSGSPVFLDGGQQLAGILSLSETVNQGGRH